jgi:hypothetical protein
MFAVPYLLRRLASYYRSSTYRPGAKPELVGCAGGAARWCEWAASQLCHSGHHEPSCSGVAAYQVSGSR